MGDGRCGWIGCHFIVLLLLFVIVLLLEIDCKHEGEVSLDDMKKSMS